MDLKEYKTVTRKDKLNEGRVLSKLLVNSEIPWGPSSSLRLVKKLQLPSFKLWTSGPVSSFPRYITAYSHNLSPIIINNGCFKI